MEETSKHLEETMTEKLSAADRDAVLKNLSGWEEGINGKFLKKIYTFNTFPEAFSFMTRVALFIEKTNHHPEWTNAYNKVHVTLTTHDCKGISEKDIALALYMDEAAFVYVNPCMSDQSGLIF